jgi:hypothetical protein
MRKMLVTVMMLGFLSASQQAFAQNISFHAQRIRLNERMQRFNAECLYGSAASDRYAACQREESAITIARVNVLRQCPN